VSDGSGQDQVDWAFRLDGIKVWSADRQETIELTESSGWAGSRSGRRIGGKLMVVEQRFDEGSGGQVQVGWAFMLGAIKVWSADWQDIFRFGREKNDGSSDFGGRESVVYGDAPSQNQRNVKTNVHSQQRDQSQVCSSKVKCVAFGREANDDSVWVEGGKSIAVGDRAALIGRGQVFKVYVLRSAGQEANEGSI
jgi:hypothetical protein